MIWRKAFWLALPVTVLVLSLFYYWFALADRYRVFLYYHDMGPLVPDTSPFSVETSSRYWMAGLVAAGGVLVLFTGLSWLLGRTLTGYRPASWWRVWLFCAGPLSIGIPAITMTVNQPKLLPYNALQVTLVTLTGLALALMPGKLAVEAPFELLWLTLDGGALMLILSALVGLDDLGTWLSKGLFIRVLIVVALIFFGLVGLLMMTAIRLWLDRPAPGAGAVFIAGLSFTYLLLPLLHHIAFTDGYYYISSASNFFVNSIALQIAVWLFIALVVVGLTHLGEYLASRRLISQQTGRQTD